MEPSGNGRCEASVRPCDRRRRDEVESVAERDGKRDELEAVQRADLVEGLDGGGDLIRGALLALIGLEPDMKVVADLDNGDDIMPTARRLRPDVAVLDIELPGVDGLT